MRRHRLGARRGQLRTGQGRQAVPRNRARCRCTDTRQLDELGGVGSRSPHPDLGVSRLLRIRASAPGSEKIHRLVFQSVQYPLVYRREAQQPISVALVCL